MTGDVELGHAVLTIARSAIAARLGRPVAREPEHPALREHGASFVTLRQGDALRGCIGTIRPVRPLGADVHENAEAAAFHDSRFTPLAAHELDSTEIEVSLLSRDERLPAMDEDVLLRVLRPHVDGIILEYAHHRATLLPQVWEAIPDPREFMETLKSKAGLSPRFWSPEVCISRYGVVRWTESEMAESITQERSRPRAILQ